MATYVNDLRLTELATGEGSGTWGTTTNTNLELIGEALGFGTQDCFASDADATTTVADGSTDPARSMFFKVTSSATLSATRTLTIAPNTLSRVMIIENATTGSQSINISQGSGANVTIASGNAKIVYLDGAGSGAAVVDALIDLELADVASATIATADINGGTIDGVTIGGASAGAGSFTTLTASDDVNFDSGTLFVDASADSVGIGTTTVNEKLVLGSADSGSNFLQVTNSTTTAADNRGFYVGIDATEAARLLNRENTALVFSTNNTDAARITNDQKFLVGNSTAHATSSTFAGLTQFSTGVGIQKRDGGVVKYFDRLTDDGDIHVFQRDATEVGVIGAKSGDLIIGTGTTGQRFLDGDPSISPVTTNGGTLNDNTIDLGRGTGRWKDLYLGGGLYVGGTGSANFLDDYEEGTWTPVVADATSGGNTASATIDRADYTKIGRQVTVTTRIRNIDTTGMTSSNIIYIRGLPFASKSNHITIGSVKPSLITFGTSGSRTDLICQVGPSASWANFVYQGDGVTEGNVDVSDVTSGTGDFTFTITYFTA